MGDNDMITGGEFGRFRADFTAYQERMVQQLQAGFDGVHSRLDDLNGRTRKNEMALAAQDVHIARIDGIEQTMNEMQAKGCSMFEQHRVLMTPAEIIEEDRPKWPTRRQVVTGGGLVGAGVAAVPIIEALGRVLHSLLTK